jgi:IS5 family transposase
LINSKHAGILEKHKLSRQLFKEVNRWLSDPGIYLKERTIVDATIIEAASSTKNKAKERDPLNKSNSERKAMALWSKSAHWCGCKNGADT